MDNRSIWATVESDAWAKNLDYESYLKLHELQGVQGSPLCEEAWQQVADGLETQMERDMTLASNEGENNG